MEGGFGVLEVFIEFENNLLVQGVGQGVSHVMYMNIIFTIAIRMHFLLFHKWGHFLFMNILLILICHLQKRELDGIF